MPPTKPYETRLACVGQIICMQFVIESFFASKQEMYIGRKDSAYGPGNKMLSRLRSLAEEGEKTIPLWSERFLNDENDRMERGSKLDHVLSSGSQLAVTPPREPLRIPLGGPRIAPPDPMAFLILAVPIHPALRQLFHKPPPGFFSLFPTNFSPPCFDLGATRCG